MQIKALSWMGVKTAQFDPMVQFCQEVLQLRLDLLQPDFAIFRLPNGDTVELFGPGGPNGHLAAGTVLCGFSVDDIEQARQALIQAGIELIGPLHIAEHGSSAWQHFRGPDGNIYEVNAQLSQT